MLNERVSGMGALIAVGPNAFSKYERGEVLQSDAMDALLYIVHKFPFTLDALRHRHNGDTVTKVVTLRFGDGEIIF